MDPTVPAQTEPALSYASGARAELRFGAGFTQARDLDAWRRTEQAPVFAAELRRAFVADAMPGGGAFDAVGEHHPPRFVQPQVLLVLQRGHRSDRLETMMQRRRTHVHGFGQFLDAQRRRVALLEPFDGADDAVIAAIALG